MPDLMPDLTLPEPTELFTDAITGVTYATFPGDVHAMDTSLDGSTDDAPVWFDGYPYMTAADAREAGLSLLAAARWREDRAGPCVVTAPDVLAELWAALGHDPHRTGTVSVDAELLRRAHGDITDARWRAEAVEATVEKQRGRISRLERSCGALQVDRDRAQRDGAEKALAAFKLARQMAAEAGREIGDRDVADRIAYDRHVTALLEAQSAAWERFHDSVQSAVLAVEDRLAFPEFAGHEAELLAALLKEVRKASRRRADAPMPRWEPPVVDSGRGLRDAS